MARRSEPGLPSFKKRTRVSTTRTGLTRAVTSVEPDDPTLPTPEGDVRLFLRQALERFNMAVAAENYDRIQGMIDVLMVDGEGQWDDDIRGRRQRKRRPCLTLNRFIPMIAHVANEQRMSRPSIQVDPVGGGADPDSAAIRQGILRHIEVVSGAETIYDTAFERMIEKGWSWFRVVCDWESPRSFKQVIRIEGFTNDFCVYSDPTAQEPTRKDQKWAFVVYDMPRGMYTTQHPKSRVAGLSSFSSIGDDAPGWLTTDSVRVAEYYYIEEEPGTLYDMADGSEPKFEDELDGTEYLAFDDDGRPVTRESYRPRVKWAKINALEILDGDAGSDIAKNKAGRDIPGEYIPLIHVCGKERIVRSQRRRAGMVRNNRDAQRMYNYAVSAFVEMIALAPKSPFIAAAGQIEKYKNIWDTANDENWPYLPYDPVTVNQQNVPPPQRQNIEPPVMALIQAIREFDQDLKIGFNIFDPSIGQSKSEQSGRAVVALQNRSESANMNWLDNMRRSIVFAGEVILGQIPFVYDAARIVPIVRPGNEREEVLINQEFADKEGVIKNYDMAVGKYSCTVSIGEYASKRQAAVQSLSDIAKNVPGVALPLLPLILENMDTPMAKEAAEIIRRLQPPEMQKPGSPEQMASQFKALMQQHEQLVQALKEANETIKNKQLETASKEYIAGLQAQAQIAIAAAKLGSVEGMAQLTLEYKRITDLLNLNNDRILSENQQAHEKDIEKMQPAPASA